MGNIVAKTSTESVKKIEINLREPAIKGGIKGSWCR